MAAKDKTEEPEVFKRDPKLNIHQRINAVMGEIDYIKKGKKISFGSGGYSVTGHDAVTALIHPVIVKHGINIIPTIQDMKQEGNRTTLNMGFDWVNIDEPTDLVHQDWGGYGIDTSDKGPGKAASYTQKNAVLKMLHLETGEMDIEEHDLQFENKKPIEHSDAVKKMTAQQDIPLPDGTQISDGTTIDGVLELKVRSAFVTRKMGTSQQKVILDAFKVDDIKQILNSDYEQVMAEINSYSGA